MSHNLVSQVPEKFFDQILSEISSGKISSSQQLEKRKKQLCKKYEVRKIPTNAEILDKSPEHVPLLVTKPTRSLSGVSVVAIMTAPRPCPGECIYCPSGEAAQSYTGYEPAALRARRAAFDSVRQVRDRIEQLEAIGHPTSKIELIIMGGTFTALSPHYQKEFVKDAFDALNENDSQNLEEAQKMNENASHKCIGLTFEVRPDYCKQQHVNSLISLGGTRVELGVQTVYDEIYKKIKRGHSVQDVEEATRLLKDSFLKVGYHLMPGLPFSTPEKDLKMFRTVFGDQRFKPDMLKIYPCLLAKKRFYTHDRAHQLYRSGQWKPLGNQEAAELIAQARKLFPIWVRVMRIQRDVPKPYIEAGVTAGNLRQLVDQKCEELGFHCQCIRCREIRDREPEEVSLLEEHYKASEGREAFLSLEDTENNWLIGFLRLRNPFQPFRPEIDERTVGIRELRVYGPQVEVGEKPGNALQHKGYGKQLLQEAEKIAREKFDAHKILITSGVGARNYYCSLGYELEGPYMSKALIE